MKSLLLAVTVFTLPLAAESALVSYNFSGTISQVTDVNAPLGDFGGITAGDSFTGSFLFDTSLFGPDANSDPNIGLYTDGTFDGRITATIDGLTFGGGPGFVQVQNNVTTHLSTTTDSLLYSSGPLREVPQDWIWGSIAGSQLRIEFLQAAGTNFLGDASPTSFDPADWNEARISLNFQNVSSPDFIDLNVLIVGTVNEIVPASVPEPGSLLLLALASAASGIGPVIRRQRPLPALGTGTH